jgi:segregation and condensation protein B
MTDRDDIDPRAHQQPPRSEAVGAESSAMHDQGVPGTGDVAQPITASPESTGRGEPAADDITAAANQLGPAIEPSTLRKVVEAILIVADQPVTDVEIAQVAEQPRAAVADVLRELAADYATDDRGFTLREVAGGWRLYSAPDCAGYVERFVLEGQQTRLTQAALETLAVVAYRQPVTRASISAIRGVNVEGVVRTLVARALIEEVGQESSGATLYATTTYFLSRLGLNSVEELPSLAPFLPVDIDSIAEQL